MIEPEDDYANDGSDNLVDEYSAHMSSGISYMPKNFLGMETKDLGFFIVGQETPFMILKKKILEEGKQLKLEDRMQGVRYLCSIPYNNATYHCVEAATSIIFDESVDVYKRFYFFDNKDKYFRLDDHVVHYCHPAFFKYGKSQGAVVVPVELMIKSAIYILNHYGSETTIRQTVLDWCLDILEDEVHQDIQTRLAIMKLLLEHGAADEQAFVNEQLEALEISHPDDVQPDVTEISAKNILRAICTKHSIKDVTPEPLFVACVQYASKHLKENTELLSRIEAFFQDIVEGESKFDNVIIGDVCKLVWLEIKSLKDDQKRGGSYVADECILRFIQLIENDLPDDCISIVQILNLLDGFTTPRELSLGPSLHERLRNDVFAALNNSLMNLNEGLRIDVQQSRKSEDKSTAREFLMFFDDEKDMLRQTYVNLCTEKEFEDLFNKVVEEWIDN